MSSRRLEDQFRKTGNEGGNSCLAPDAPEPTPHPTTTETLKAEGTSDPPASSTTTSDNAEDAHSTPETGDYINFSSRDWHKKYTDGCIQTLQCQ